jgi:hypothetical protein
MYDPDLHTWGEDTLAIVRDAEIDAEDELPEFCDEWGATGHRYEEQETWDHHIVIGCSCGHQPPPRKCVRCGRTTGDPDRWDPEAGTGRIYCDTCWPHRLSTSTDHYRTVFFGYRDNEFFSKPACGCGFTTETDAVLVAHLREKLNP